MIRCLVCSGLFYACVVLLTGTALALENQAADEAKPLDAAWIADLEKQVKALEQYRDNAFIFDENSSALNEALQKYVGVRTAWEMTVDSVARQAVYLKAITAAPGHVYFVGDFLPDPQSLPLDKVRSTVRKLQNDRRLLASSSCFQIGSTVDLELARRLRRKDRVAVTGEVARIGVDGGRLVMVISQAKVQAIGDAR